jgi:hypothetical protein
MNSVMAEMVSKQSGGCDENLAIQSHRSIGRGIGAGDVRRVGCEGSPSGTWQESLRPLHFPHPFAVCQPGLNSFYSPWNIAGIGDGIRGHFPA